MSSDLETTQPLSIQFDCNSPNVAHFPKWRYRRSWLRFWRNIRRSYCVRCNQPLSPWENYPQ